jgi:hypothetical protein
MKRIIQGSEVNDGSAGSAYGARTAVVVGAGANSVIPAGAWIVETDAHTTVEHTYDSGSNFITWVGASGVGFVTSDGFSVRVLGDGTGGTAHITQDLRVI